MKVWKKNLVAAAILVTVCAGIYVNWRYTEDQAAANLTDTLDTEKVMSDDSLVLSEDMAAISAGEDVAKDVQAAGTASVESITGTKVESVSVNVCGIVHK